MTPLVKKSFRIAALTVGAILLTVLALAQTTVHPSPPCQALITKPNPLPTHKPAPCHKGLHPETSISLGAFVQLTATRIVKAPYNFITASMSPSAGVTVTSEPNLSAVYNFTHPR